MNESAIQSLISSSLQNALGARDERGRLPAPESKLIGTDAIIDSTAFVAFVVDLERRLADAYGREILLTEDPKAFDSDGPFRSVASLAANLLVCLGRDS